MRIRNEVQKGRMTQHQQQRPPTGRGARDGIGHGIAQQQGDEGRGRGDPERGEPGSDVEIVGEEQDEVLERQAELDRRHGVGGVAAERNRQDERERQQEEEAKPYEGQRDDEAHGARSVHGLPDRARPARS